LWYAGSMTTGQLWTILGPMLGIFGALAILIIQQGNSLRREMGRLDKKIDDQSNALRAEMATKNDVRSLQTQITGLQTQGTGLQTQVTGMVNTLAEQGRVLGRVEGKLDEHLRAHGPQATRQSA